MFRNMCLILSVAVVVIVIAIPFALQSNQTGIVSGSEWSPELFQSRGFRYVAVAGVQVTPKTTTEPRRTALEQYLLDEGYVAEFPAGSATWEFVRGSAPGVRGWHGDARSAYKVLGHYDDDGGKTWIDWSHANPDAAKELWPEIVRRAQDRQFVDLYVALSVLGDKIRSAHTPVEIENAFREVDAALTR
jgi:hypothetical protein